MKLYYVSLTFHYIEKKEKNMKDFEAPLNTRPPLKSVSGWTLVVNHQVDVCISIFAIPWKLESSIGFDCKS